MATVYSGLVIAVLVVYSDVFSQPVRVASLLTVPRSSVAAIGDRVELKCRADGNQQVAWGFTSFDASKPTEIYFDNTGISKPLMSRYRIDNTTGGQHDLVIDSVDFDHAGRYQCVELSAGNIRIAHLAVLDSSPECSADTGSAADRVVENGYLWMRCSVVYAGKMTPNFNWTKVNTEDAIVANTSTSDRRSIPLTTTSSVIRQLHSDDNGAVFKCKITFQITHNISDGEAPDYEYTWNYTANVLYGPRNLSVVEYENRLECSADGSPAPTYRWTNLETNRSVEGPILSFDEGLDSDRKSNYECTALNVLGIQKKSILQLHYGSDAKGITLSTAEVALILASLSLVGVASLFLCLGLAWIKLSKCSGAGGEFRRCSDSLAKADTIDMVPSTHEDPQITATSADYCAMTVRPSTSQQEPQLYCEIRLTDQPSDDYINQPSTEI